MGWFGKKEPKEGPDALILRLRVLKQKIFNEELRESFLFELKDLSEKKVNELQGGKGGSHLSIYTMLLTAARGMRQDEINTQKMDAIDRALVMVGASRISDKDVEICYQQMMSAGLLGFGFSGGNRRTVDGKY
jgi:hypothetical protein